MAKFIDGPLTRNEFLQMAGRAGRKGFFNTGYVSYIPRSRCENFDYDTGILYLETLDKPCEEAKIKLLPRYRPPAQKRSDRRDGGQDPLRMLDAAAQPALRHARGGKLPARDNAGALRDKGPAGTRPRAPHPRRHMERRNGARAQRRASRAFSPKRASRTRSNAPSCSKKPNATICRRCSKSSASRTACQSSTASRTWKKSTRPSTR